MSSTYALSIFDIFLNHGLAKILTLRDSSDTRSMDLDVQIASGDYFITLATTLDELSQTLEHKDPSGHVVLEKAINDLTYLQQHYKIAKKSSAQK